MPGIVAWGLVALVGVFVFLWMWRSGRVEESEMGNSAGLFSIALRLHGDDNEAFARRLLSKYAGSCVADFELVVVDLMRLTPSATHFYDGPYVSELRNDLPGGVLVKFDVPRPKDHSAERSRDLAGVLSNLRGLQTGPSAILSEVVSAAHGQPMLAVQEAERPGHRQCDYCGQAFVKTDFECPSCGGQVTEA